MFTELSMAENFGLGADASTIMPWNTAGSTNVGNNTSAMNAYGFPVNDAANNNEFSFLTYVRIHSRCLMPDENLMSSPANSSRTSTV